MIPIVLTATITPNVNRYSLHSDPEKRKQEYLKAIEFYRTFSDVYFLENSGYPIKDDKEFPAEGEGLFYRSFKKPAADIRNKGAQEFGMLDNFVKDDLKAGGFVKITGRYIYKNFAEIFAFIEKEANRYELIMDTYQRKQTAFTSLFYASRRLYVEVIRGACVSMNDDMGSWAEHVIYKRLGIVNNYTFFRPLPILQMISGADGVSVDYSRTPGRNAAKNCERAVLSMMGIHQLLF